MSNEKLLGTIDDVQVRQYVRANWDGLADEAEMLVDAYGKLDPSTKADMHAAGDGYLNTMLSALVPSWDWDGLKAAIRKRIWAGFCSKEGDQGKPDPDWEGLFAQEGMGREVIEAALVAAFAAAGAAAGGALGGLLTAAVGASIRNMIVKFVCKVLDEEVRSGLNSFCAVVPG